MSKYTNLNILDGQKRRFQYIVEYMNDLSLNDTEIEYIVYQNSIYLKNIDLIKQENYWVVTDVLPSKEYTPGLYNAVNIKLYFPEFGVDIYSKNTRYILTISTWVNGKTVYLYNNVINRSDAIASKNGIKTFLNNRYYEYIEVNCVDPFHLIYGDEWKDFRSNICEEPAELNNTGSNINVQLYVVEQAEEKWIKSQEYASAQGSILLTNTINNSLRCEVSTNIKKGVKKNTPNITLSICFNDIYSQNDNGLKEYLHETYLLDTTKIKTVFNILLKDKDNVYRYIKHEYDGVIRQDVLNKNELDLTWDDYIEGLEVSGIVLFYNKDDDNGEELLGITSNVLFFNQDIYKFYTKDNVLDYVNLLDVNMRNYNINAVNRLEQNIINVERPDNYKTNIQKPVFIRTQDIRQIIIHPSVTENIVINLDAYKSKVDAFVLKIESSIFPEIGRVSSGVIFKITGSKLDTNISDGIYYILDSNQEMVTSGKYIVM